MQYDPNIHAPWVKEYGLREPYGYCQCGCGDLAPVADMNHTATGMRIGHPRRYVRGHQRNHPTLLDAFRAHYREGNPGECWPWELGIYRGYGHLQWRGTTYRAHRLSMRFNKPEEYSEEYLVRHLCDNPTCVNPDHLAMGTVWDNSQDMVRNGRSLYGERHPNNKLTEDQVLEIRRRVDAGESHRVLGRRYGVSYPCIHKIANRITWKHL